MLSRRMAGIGREELLKNQSPRSMLVPLPLEDPQFVPEMLF